MSNTPTDDGELRKQLIDIVFADGASNPEMIVDKFLLPLIHQYGNTRAVEATQKTEHLYKRELDSLKAFQASVIRNEELKLEPIKLCAGCSQALTQPQKENK